MGRSSITNKNRNTYDFLVYILYPILYLLMYIYYINNDDATAHTAKATEKVQSRDLMYMGDFFSTTLITNEIFVYIDPLGYSDLPRQIPQTSLSNIYSSSRIFRA